MRNRSSFPNELPQLSIGKPNLKIKKHLKENKLKIRFRPKHQSFRGLNNFHSSLENECQTQMKISKSVRRNSYPMIAKVPLYKITIENYTKKNYKTLHHFRNPIERQISASNLRENRTIFTNNKSTKNNNFFTDEKPYSHNFESSQKICNQCGKIISDKEKKNNAASEINTINKIMKTEIKNEKEDQLNKLEKDFEDKLHVILI